MKPKAFVFDAYGTLFDVHAAVLRAGQGIEGDLNALSRLWRQKQLEQTWLRSLMGRYENFAVVTESSLRSAVALLGMAVDDFQVKHLMDAYFSLPVFPDVPPALQALHGSPLAILSNGSTAMLDAIVHRSGLGSYFSEVISVDRVDVYKPSPKVYALGPEILGIPAEETLFVSSNAWDAAGAKAFGYRVCWCNRAGVRGEQNFGFAPDMEVSSLEEIASLI